MIFKNWLETRPKMKTHDPNVYPTILGGVSRGFLSLFLVSGTQSPIFWHFKTVTFGKSGRFQVPKNGTSSAQIQKLTPKTSRKTPQNGGVDIWFRLFHFWVSEDLSTFTKGFIACIYCHIVWELPLESLFHCCVCLFCESGALRELP